MKKTKVNLKEIAEADWTQYWSGRWSVLTTYYFGYYYTNLMAKQMGAGLTKVVAVSHQGHTSCYFERRDRAVFGDHMVQQVHADEQFIRRFTKELKQKADAIRALVMGLGAKKVGEAEFKQYLTNFFDYTGRHISPRHVVDHIAADKLETVLEQLKDARVYTESVYHETEMFMQTIAASISRGSGYKPEHVLCMTGPEFETYLKSNELISEKILAERYAATALVWWLGKFWLVTGQSVADVESALAKPDTIGRIKGVVAYKGKAMGVVRIVFDPAKVRVFNEGDILITGMTRPEFLPLMHKAGAIVTDSGGVLSHAAITARELKKPCLISTEVATKALADGSVVEVDAEAGVVRVIK